MLKKGDKVAWKYHGTAILGVVELRMTDGYSKKYSKISKSNPMVQVKLYGGHRADFYESDLVAVK